MAAKHAVVVAKDTSHGIVEEQLIRARIDRPVILKLPHFAAVPYIISESDLVVKVPDKLANATQHRFWLSMHEHPLSFPEIFFQFILASPFSSRLWKSLVA